MNLGIYVVFKRPKGPNVTTMFSQKELQERKADQYEVTVEESTEMVDGDYAVSIQVRDIKTKRIIRE